MSHRFHPTAEAEHYETIAFYESRQTGLGKAYLAEFEQIMAQAVEGPSVVSNDG